MLDNLTSYSQILNEESSIDKMIILLSIEEKKKKNHLNWIYNIYIDGG